jgi:glycosyltransferase involved in cell wall biosynthesis
VAHLVSQPTEAPTYPTISVITATRNVSGCIETLFQSLHVQRYRNFEWIVVDAQSNDGTVELLTDLAQHHPWIRFTSERDFGVYDALNKAIRSARAPFYVVAGADDFFTSDALEQYASASQDRDVVLADVIRGGRRRGGFAPGRGWLGPASVFRGSHSVGMLFRRSLHDRFGMYTHRFPLLADSFFLKTLLRAHVRIHYVGFVAGTFTEGGLTTTQQLQILAETWQIQMLTEPRPMLQLVLFYAKSLIRFRVVSAELTQQAPRDT